jgi:hypothetical protein
MSKILELTENSWEEEIKSSELPERTRELLAKAVRAKTTGNYPWPQVSEEEFNDIIGNHVFFIRLGTRGLILDRKGRSNHRYLFLQEEKTDD